MIAARDLRFAFDPSGEPVVDIGQFSVPRGQHTAIVGPSGCGKTTLLRLLTGILSPTAGTIEFDGHRLDRLSDARRRALRIARVGFVFQRFALLDYCTALENILVPLRLGGGALDSGARDRARELAKASGIEHTLARRPHRLSQGEQQRVAICRALIAEPTLIACDEPTGNLDPRRTETVLSLILEQAERAGATVLLVTHDHALLPRFEQVLDMGAPEGVAP
ncbi:MAG: ABC transporter ATP-binding protein [Phycisphaerales bacterium]|nr:ABC transporter ATP-binding protein [Phycisphaerales bacterium]